MCTSSYWPLVLSLIAFFPTVLSAEEESGDSDADSTEKSAEDEFSDGGERADASDEMPVRKDEPPTEKKEKKKIKKFSMLKISARVHGGWDFKHKSEPVANTSNGTVSKDDVYENTFYVRKARLKLEWTPTDWLLGVLQIDAAAGLSSEFLRDAYVHVSPFRQLEIRVGQFKKPFSGLELTSPAKARIIEKGPGNSLIVESLGFGERDLGLQLSGRLLKSLKLDYEIGVFNGSGSQIDDPGKSKDLVGRVQIRPFKPLTLGANGSLKWFDKENFDEGKPSNAWAAGADALLSKSGFRLFLEGLFGENHNAYIYAADDADTSSPPMFLNGTATISYKRALPVSWGFAMEPALKVEFLEPDANITSDEIWAVTIGLNTYFGKYLRLMINGQFIRSSKNSETDYPDSDAIMALLCLDI